MAFLGLILDKCLLIYGLSTLICHLRPPADQVLNAVPPLAVFPARKRSSQAVAHALGWDQLTELDPLLAGVQASVPALLNRWAVHKALPASQHFQPFNEFCTAVVLGSEVRRQLTGQTPIPFPNFPESQAHTLPPFS